MERWLPVVGYEGYYEVSNLGRVRSVTREITQIGKAYNYYKRTFQGRVLKLIERTDGYLSVSLSLRGESSRRCVHQLVCEAFIGARPSHMSHTRHLDGNRKNNNLSNLTWGTPSENVADAIDHGTNYQKNKTHCPRGHEYNLQNTSFRPGRVEGQLSRSCRRCSQERTAESQAWRLENDPNYHPRGTGWCRNGHRITPENTRFVKGRDGSAYGRCRRCMNDQKLKSARAKRGVLEV